MSKQLSSRSKKAESFEKAGLRLAEIDRRIVELLESRAELFQKVVAGTQPDEGAVKMPPPDSEGPLSRRCLEAVFRELQSGCLELIRPTRVAYLGPELSYTHLAAIQRFGQSAELAPVADIAAVFEEVDRGNSRFGVVPIENSTDGRIVDTLEMFTRLPVRICGEVQLFIHHNLLALGTRGDIEKVCSKPQALSQCRHWLAKHLPQVELVEMSSTTAAAARAATDRRIAAIASRQAGVHYGLKLIDAAIEDHGDNVTRFVVIGPNPAEPTGHDKCSLLLGIPHKPGALADVMGIFRRKGLNLTWIESFPIPGVKHEYLFFVELEGHHLDPPVQSAVAALRKKAPRVDLLGSYRVTEPVG